MTDLIDTRGEVYYAMLKFGKGVAANFLFVVFGAAEALCRLNTETKKWMWKNLLSDIGDDGYGRGW